MRRIEWKHEASASSQLVDLCGDANEIGYLEVAFPDGGDGEPLPWTEVEPWTKSRAVTVADVAGRLASPALDVALCSDLVYLRTTAILHLAPSDEPPSDGVIWALGRAGRAALARGLLEVKKMPVEEALALGVATAVVAPDEPLPLATDASWAALTAARDLMRAAAHGSRGLALELASFRLLFAAGDPKKGARAFLEKRDPEF